METNKPKRQCFEFNAGNSDVVKVIEANANDSSKIFFEKVLDRIAGPVLYKKGCATE